MAQFRVGRDGFLSGARLPDTVYGPLHFVDQEWEKPDKDRYMVELKTYQPPVATVVAGATARSVALSAQNAVRAVTGDAFRTFLHAPFEMDRLIRGSGFAPSVRRTTWVWCADVYAREPGSARLG